MNKRQVIRVLCIVILLLIICTNVLAVSYPLPTKEFFVNDFANIVDSRYEDEINSLGKQLEDKTGAQVVVAAIDSLEGQSIDEYAVKLFESWRIGQKDKDNGVLILLALKERQLRIEVGYGLEAALTAVETADIRENYMNPYLGQNDFNNGILQGYIATVQEVAKEYDVDITNSTTVTPKTNVRYSTGRNTGSNTNNIFIGIFIIIFLIIDGVLFRFRITSTLIKIAFYSSIFRGGGRGGRGGFGGGGFGGSSGGGGRSGGGGSSGGF